MLMPQTQLPISLYTMNFFMIAVKIHLQSQASVLLYPTLVTIIREQMCIIISAIIILLQIIYYQIVINNQHPDDQSIRVHCHSKNPNTLILRCCILSRFSRARFIFFFQKNLPVFSFAPNQFV